jgi:predicted AAA+ superfamily ATPase
MQGYIARSLEAEVHEKLRENPVVAIVGPRQCGKTTLARRVLGGLESTVFLDLERPSDAARLQDPEAFFALHAGETVCLDEVQRFPELFPVLRAIVDSSPRHGQVLVLGSASPDLLRQSSETLAGRISFVELTPFLVPELLSADPPGGVDRLWLRGGFPRSVLATSDASSATWREDFVRTFLERDVPQLRARVPVPRLASFWRMCAHEHGNLLNGARLGASLGVSAHTIRAYLELLEATFMLRLLPPLEANLTKRLVKSPKVFLRDTGILHSLLDIVTPDDLLGHPCRGSSWEGLVVENVVAAFPGWRSSFFRTRAGAELDLVLERGTRRLGVECKASSSPTVSRGFWSALHDLEILEAYIVTPAGSPYPLGSGVAAISLEELLSSARTIAAGTPHRATRSGR